MKARLSRLIGSGEQAWRWPAMAMAASASLLVAAHAFEIFGHMAPCPLCLRQREVYWAALTLGAVCLGIWRVRRDARILMNLNMLLSVVFLTGFVVAGFHWGVELGLFPAPSGCAGGVMPTLTGSDLMASLDKPMAVASCSEVPWSLFGLSMAAYNTLFLALFTGISLFAATQASATSERYEDDIAHA